MGISKKTKNDARQQLFFLTSVYALEVAYINWQKINKNATAVF